MYMNGGVKIAGDKLAGLIKERGWNRNDLARRIGSTGSQMWSLITKGNNTGFRFLKKLVPVFGLDSVCELILDPDQRREFRRWYRIERVYYAKKKR